MNKQTSIIDSDPRTEQVKQYIYSQKSEGVGYRLISQGLHDLFDIKLSYTGVKKWMDKNPLHVAIIEDAEQLTDFDTFDFDLYENLLPENATEIERTKAKIMVLMSCNLDRHIEDNKRLNGDYLKHLKTIAEIEQIERKNTPVTSDKEHKLTIEIIDPKPNLDLLTLDELNQLLHIHNKLGLSKDGVKLPYKPD
jgi:hypothetical protein